MRSGAPGTASSTAPRSGTSVQPSRRAECAGKSAVRSGVAVNTALTTRSAVTPLRRISVSKSRAVASRMSVARFARTEIAPQTAAMVVPGFISTRSHARRRLPRPDRHLVQLLEVLADHALGGELRLRHLHARGHHLRPARALAPRREHPLLQRIVERLEIARVVAGLAL